VSGSFTPLAALPQGKSPRCPLDGRLGESQGRSGRYGEVNIFYPSATRSPARQSSCSPAISGGKRLRLIIVSKTELRKLHVRSKTRCWLFGNLRMSSEDFFFLFFRNFSKSRCWFSVIFASVRTTVTDLCQKLFAPTLWWSMLKMRAETHLRRRVKCPLFMSDCSLNRKKTQQNVARGSH
jgi:hypothetical protein